MCRAQYPLAFFDKVGCQPSNNEHMNKEQCTLNTKVRGTVAVKDVYDLRRTSVNIAVLKRVLCDGTSAAVSTVYSPSYR